MRRILNQNCFYLSQRWEHSIHKNIKWFFARVEHKQSDRGPLLTREDVAYFVHPKTSQKDAQMFAYIKNHGIVSDKKESLYHTVLDGIFYNSWDKSGYHHLINWIVSEWCGEKKLTEKENNHEEAVDVAYFLNLKTHLPNHDITKKDVQTFVRMRERLM